tara:strand:+ start:14 stop:544 length:531 start_codon:yes stop_codon:yes gene_type:complete
MAAFTVIDHTEIGVGGAASWTKSSIPSTYDHLLLKISSRSEGGTYYEQLNLQFNSDTGSNYSYTSIYAAGSTVYSGRGTTTVAIRNLYANGSSNTADAFGSINIWIPNYANASNFKQAITNSVTASDSTTDWQWTLFTGGGLWQSTAAISEVSVSPVAANDFAQYSTFTLYGVTGA